MKTCALTVVTAVVMTACGGSQEPAAGACSVPAGSSILKGKVSAVHDGDTLTLNDAGTPHTVRLGSIDAPELGQDFGAAAHQTLSDWLLGQSVQVAWHQRDRYDRVVGTVFNKACSDVNLQMVQQGMAWFYLAYQCDLQPAQRLQFAQAQAQAKAARWGLWAQPQPQAPWVFRNGADPVVPVCTP